MKMVIVLSLFLIMGSSTLKAVDVQAYPAIDLVQLPSNDLIFANVTEDARGPYYLTIVRRNDGLYEKGMLRFHCREDQNGGDVCTIGARAYKFLALYMKCDRSGECEEEVTRDMHRRSKFETAAASSM